MTSAHGFSRAERIRIRSDFSKLSSSSIKVQSFRFLLVALPNNSSSCRIGITASRKVGNAVCRNRIKRMVREFYRNHKGIFPTADINFIARKGADKLPYSELCQELVNAIHRIGQQLRS